MYAITQKQARIVDISIARGNCIQELAQFAEPLPSKMLQSQTQLLSDRGMDQLTQFLSGQKRYMYMYIITVGKSYNVPVQLCYPYLYSFCWN